MPLDLQEDQLPAAVPWSLPLSNPVSQPAGSFFFLHHKARLASEVGCGWQGLGLTR